MRSPRHYLLKATFFLFRLVSDRDRVAGIEVILMGPPPDAPGCLRELAAAVERLQDDERRWQLVRRHIRYIGVAEYGGAGFIRGLGLCVVGVATLRNGPLYTAGVIVHEMTHARLFDRGFRYTPETRAREEALCVKEAFRFLNRSSEGRPVAEMYAAQAARAFAEAEPWYSERRRDRYGADAMDFYGVPKWLQWLRRLVLGRN